MIGRGSGGGRTVPAGARGRRLLVSALLALGLVIAVDTPSAAMEVVSHSSYTDADGRLHIVGEVVNRRAATLGPWTVGISLNDQRGAELRYDQPAVLVDAVAPGERSPFHHVVDPPSDYDHYAIRGGMLATQRQDPGNHRFTVTVDRTFADESGAEHVVGRVTNDNHSGTADSVEVVATFYDGSRTVDAATAFVNTAGSSLGAGQSASFELVRTRGAPGHSSSVFTAQSPTPATHRPPPLRGYWMIGRTGDTYSFGDAKWHANTPYAGADIVDLEPTASGGGYWTVTSAGHVYAFGDATHHGGTPPLGPDEKVTSLSRATTGYWLFTTRGRVLPFGGAGFHGDMSGTPLNGPVQDSIPTPSGDGYYMVASDGGIFTFGDATFHGSMGGVPLNQPVQSLVPDPDGTGYWLVASDGGIFSFDAAFYGSMGATPLNKPVTGMVGFGAGYLMVAEDGGIFTFGGSPFFGSLGDRPPLQPIVSAAVLNLH